jgi:hypothetical protein
MAGLTTLTLSCPRCRERFPSVLGVDEPTFETMTVDRVVERCPDCGHVSRFEKRDYYFVGRDVASGS